MSDEPPTESTAARLARIEVKLDLVLTRHEDHETRLRKLEAHGCDTHESRITALERWKYALPPAVLVALVEGAVIAWKVSGK